MPEVFRIDGQPRPCEGQFMSVRDVIVSGDKDWRTHQLRDADTGQVYANRGERIKVDGRRFETLSVE